MGSEAGQDRAWSGVLTQVTAPRRALSEGSLHVGLGATPGGGGGLAPACRPRGSHSQVRSPGWGVAAPGLSSGSS